jgi:hypothetical protein
MNTLFGGQIFNCGGKPIDSNRVLSLKTKDYKDWLLEQLPKSGERLKRDLRKKGGFHEFLLDEVG